MLQAGKRRFDSVRSLDCLRDERPTVRISSPVSDKNFRFFMSPIPALKPTQYPLRGKASGA
jgi:hypothetical protein